MAMTGDGLWLYTQGLIDKDFSDFVSPAKANRMFKKAMYNVVEQKLAALDSQKIYDELSFLIMSDVLISGVNNNRVNTRPMAISGVTIPSVNTVAITTLTPHNMSVNSSVVISDVGGVPLANGSFFVTAVGSSTLFTVTSPGVAGIYTSGGSCYASALQVTDYMRFLSAKATCEEKLSDVYVSNATNASPIVVTLSVPTKIRTGMKIKLSGINGNTASNGTFYPKQLSDKKYELYTDAEFLSPTTAAGDFLASPSSVVYAIWENYCTPQFSSRKISSMSSDSPARPMYMDSSVSISILAGGSSCTDLLIDYVRIPPVEIDVSDTVVDLTLIYPQKFLYSIADAFAVEYSQGVKDDMLYKTASTETIKNP
jgi:hypothetical protein